MAQESTWIEDGFIKPFRIKITGNNFDIYETVTSRKRDKETNKLTDETFKREKLVSSQSSIGNCLKMIIHLKVGRNHKKMDTLRDFFHNLMQVKKEVNSLLMLLDISPDEKVIQLENRIKVLEAKLKDK